MSPEKKKEIVIPKEDAVFWLDAQGRWCNASGEIEHKRIKAYFHASIQKDADGYHVCQTFDDAVEKVYFHYEDCALFVFDVIKDRRIMLVLNTKKHVELDPETLFIQGDNLYTIIDGERVKFIDRALLKIADLMASEGDQDFIRVGDRQYWIRQESNPKRKR
jgi:hypothetical protein